jgi:diguanylate cyclase (GGDEF)-like protein
VEPALEHVAVLYESDRTRVSRVLVRETMTTLIHKQPLGPGALERTAHERRILQRLDAAPGVARLASQCFDGLLLDDDAGDTLSAAIRDRGPLGVPACLRLALVLTRTLGALHRAGVVHRDVNPSNVLVTGCEARPVLIDFDLATTFTEDRPRFVHPRQMVGTFPYLAPEQTGRTGGVVDERADLYSLGATLYEAATGRAPFPPGAPLQTLRDVLTRVPTPPDEVDTRLPRQLSLICLRLLEKEPDRRYQSAEGLELDLARLADALAGDGDELFELGQLDFPARLMAPSRLIGRQQETATLRSAFEASLDGGSRAVFVAGAPGAGKTALVDGLRPAVGERGGWFVSGKFDQHRQDAGANAVHLALRALGRLLLAGTDAEVATARSRIRAALGRNCRLAAAMLPEFATLLDVVPEPGPAPDGSSEGLANRLHQTALGLLRGVASAEHPVVVVLDDLQWAGAIPVGFIDAILADGSLPGVLLVGIYRAGELDASHPLSAALARWRGRPPAPATVRVDNLAPADLGELLSDMLRLPTDRAAELAAAVGVRTGGNPYDTVELVNDLRREGILVAEASGWTWEADAIRRFVGRGDIVDLLAVRLQRLPGPARELLEIVACLGGEVPRDLLQTAAALSDDEVDERLGPALEHGLLIPDSSEDPTLRFRHDRVQQAAYSLRSPQEGGRLHLEIARRLRAAGVPAGLTADQYLAGWESITDDRERRTAATLFLEAAEAVGVLNPAGADRFLTAAMALLSAAGPPPGDPLVAQAQRQRHRVMYRLGRLAEADAVYAELRRHGGDAVQTVDSGCVQVDSLSIRGQSDAAVALGLDLLSQLGIRVPAGDPCVPLARWSDELARSGAASLDDEAARPEVTDARVVLAGKLIRRLLPASFFREPSVWVGLALTSYQLLAEHGPCAPLVANLSTAPITMMMLREDYGAAYAIGRHAIALAERRGYEHEAAYCRHMFALCAQHWGEPLGKTIEPSQRAREELVRGGDLNSGCFTYFTSLAALLDCASTLDGCAADVEAALAFSSRTGNDHAAGSYVAFRQLVRALRGETSRPGSFDDDTFNEARHLARLGANPMAAAYFHAYRALSAALMDDPAALADHSSAAMSLLPYIVGFYPVALVHLLHGLAQAHRVRQLPERDPSRPSELDRLERTLAWLRDRSADAPRNFAHLAALLGAERAWAVGEPWEAARYYDAARGQVARGQRPWHQALITERAAAFHLAAGLEQAGQDLLREARSRYAAWCATGKVRQLEQDHPFLTAASARRPGGDRRAVSSSNSSGTSSDEIDLLAILDASRVLSSETDLGRLRTRIGQLLGAMTGADTVMIVLRDESDEWALWDTIDDRAPGLTLDRAQALVPLTVLRYVQRTREPLMLQDAAGDGRFSADPYLTGMDRCSLLAIPVLRQGELRAVLLLENRQRRGAFAAAGLDAVMLVTGQLAVSLDNAQLYASLEYKVSERTVALEEANRALAVLSKTDELTQLPNRRQFDVTLDAEWRRAARTLAPFAVAMVDVDHFKRYNDRHGHPAGDSCLRLVAAALNEARRAGDTACRYGGEEFTLILPDTDQSGGLQLAERVRAAVEALTIPTPREGPSRITISVGLAAHLPGSSATAADTVAAADQALYEAKRAGRNTVRTTNC